MASATPPPPTRRGQVTRERILDAATALMYDRGVAATSIDDVKAAAGVSSSQLYHYFADRRSLVSAVIARQTERVLDFQEARLLDVEDRDALRAWRDGIVEVVQTRGGAGGCPIGSLASELSDRDDVHRMALLAAFERWQEVIATGLARMRDRGSLPAGVDPGELALALLAALQGGLLLAQTRRSATPVAVALDAIIERITVSADGG